jgi:hypothetical protein
MIRDEDGDEMAEFGLPAGPPDMSEIDCEVMKREINNLLVKNGIFTTEDLNKSTVGLQVFQTVVKRHVKSMFREKDRRDKENKQ